MSDKIANLHYLVTLSHEQAVRDFDAITAASKRATKSMAQDFIDATNEVNKFDKMLEQITRQSVRGTATSEGIRKLEQMLEHYKRLDQSNPAVTQRIETAQAGIGLYNTRQLPMHPIDSQRAADEYLEGLRRQAETDEAVRKKTAQDRMDAANAAAYQDRQRQLQNTFDDAGAWTRHVDDTAKRMQEEQKARELRNASNRGVQSPDQVMAELARLQHNQRQRELEDVFNTDAAAREQANRRITSAPGLPIYGDSNILRHDQQFQGPADAELQREEAAKRSREAAERDAAAERMAKANAERYHEKQRELQQTFDNDAEQKAARRRVTDTDLPILGGSNVAAQARRQIEIDEQLAAQRRNRMIEEHQFYNRNGGLREVVPHGPLPASAFDPYSRRGSMPVGMDPVLSRQRSVQGSDPYSMNLSRTGIDNLADQHAHFQRLAREGKNVEVQLEKINREFMKRDPYAQGIRDKIRELRNLARQGQDTATEITKLQKKLALAGTTDAVADRMDAEGLGARGMGKGSRGRQTRFAMSNIAFGVEDFAISYQMAGLEAGLRASANNISAIIASTARTTSGMMMGIVGATGAAIVIPMLANMIDNLGKSEEKLEERTKRVSDAIERMSKNIQNAASIKSMWEEGNVKGLAAKKKQNEIDQSTTQDVINNLDRDIAASEAKKKKLETDRDADNLNKPPAQGHGGVWTPPSKEQINRNKQISDLEEDIKLKKEARAKFAEDLTGHKLEGDRLKGADQLLEKVRKFDDNAEIGRMRFQADLDRFEERQDKPMTGDELRSRMEAQRKKELEELRKGPYTGEQLKNRERELNREWDGKIAKEGTAQDIRRENFDERKAKAEKESAERLERDLIGATDKRKAIELAHAKRLEDINKNETLSPEKRKELEDLSKKAMSMDLASLGNQTHPDQSAIRIGTTEDLTYRNRVTATGPTMEIVTKAIETQGAASVKAFNEATDELKQIVKLLKMGTV